MTRFIFFFLLLTLPQFSCLQNTNEQKRSALEILPLSDYRDDLKELVQALKDNHPKLYEFTPRDSFDLLVQRELAELNDSTTVGEFVWACRKVAASVGCGHTYLPYMGEGIYLPESYLFPVYALYINDRLFVVDPLVNSGKINKGAEIMSINGIAVADLQERLYEHISSDGHIRSLKNNFTNKSFMHYCAFEMGFPKQYTVTFRNENEEIKTTELMPVNKFEESTNYLNNCPGQLCFKINKDNNTAIMTIRSFDYYGDNFIHFKKFIDDSFADIKRLEPDNLIIDLRENGGGDPYCASYLMQHFADRSFQYYKSGTSQGYKDLQTIIEPHENRFNKKPYVLINGKCFSTTGHLCSLIKKYNFGIFIGTETGATYTCNANQTRFNLEKTGLLVSIARGTYQTTADHLPDDRGIVPDHEVEPILSDVLQNIDTEMEFIFNLLKE